MTGLWQPREEQSPLIALLQDRGESDTDIDPAVVSMAREVLLSSLPESLLDPFSPPDIRYPVVYQVLRKEIQLQSRTGVGGPLANYPADDSSLQRLYRMTIGWGPAQPYLDDPRVQEVKISGTVIFVLEEGASEFSVARETFPSGQDVLARVQTLADRLNVTLNRQMPQATIPVSYGSRVHVTIPPYVDADSPLVCIRRGRQHGWRLADLEQRRAASAEVFQALRSLIRYRCSFLIVGSTGTGKTTLLEAMVNDWEGTPHVISIEDNVQELRILHRGWTRIIVNTATDPNAYGRVAREALRQTPSVLVPGEMRSFEAGAILSLATSGHAVLSTIHADDPAQGVLRLADYASMPQAYHYAHQRSHALEDICSSGFDVVVVMRNVSGRRIIADVSLICGVQRTESGELHPRLTSLARAKIVDDTTIVWELNARFDDHGLLVADSLPPRLAAKAQQYHARAVLPTTGRNRMETIKKTVDAHIVAGRPALAAQQLEEFWRQRIGDAEIYHLAVRARSALPLEEQTRLNRIASDLTAKTRDAIRRQSWGEARSFYQQIVASVMIAAALPSPSDLTTMRDTIAAGEEATRLARHAIQQARQAMQQQQWTTVLELLAPHLRAIGMLDPTTKTEAQQLAHIASHHLQSSHARHPTSSREGDA